MKRIVLITLIYSGMVLSSFSQKVELTAVYDGNNAIVKLNWNMVMSNSKTSYLLLRSADGIAWTEAARDRMLRNYTEDDIFFFNDKHYFPGKNLYRIRIYDGNNNTIALSPIVAVNTQIIKPARPVTAVKENNKQSQRNTIPKSNNDWVIYPNPAKDFLKLAYKGSADLKGVVNVQIQDARGRVVINYRSGSMYRTIEISISNLQKGAYFIRVTVLNELMMSQKFIKQ